MHSDFARALHVVFFGHTIEPMLFFSQRWVGMEPRRGNNVKRIGNQNGKGDQTNGPHPTNCPFAPAHPLSNQPPHTRPATKPNKTSPNQSAHQIHFQPFQAWINDNQANSRCFLCCRAALSAICPLLPPCGQKGNLLCRDDIFSQSGVVFPVGSSLGFQPDWKQFNPGTSHDGTT